MKKKRKSMFLYYPLIYSKLVLYFFSFYAFLFFGLLADAKLGKYGPKYFVSRDLTGDFSEVVHAFSNVLGEEVSGEAGL